MLTDKAKEDFLSYVYENYPVHIHDSEKWFIALYEEFQISLIIKWFDSVNIYIQVKRFIHGFEFKEWYFIITDDRGMHLNNHVSNESRIKNDSRQEILMSAILKANEIYNENINHELRRRI